MKKFTFKNVLDGFRSSVTTSGSGTSATSSTGAGGERPYPVNEIVENLKPEYFNVTKTFCHGFPFQPTSIAFDPVQKLIAIGTQCGTMRLFSSRLKFIYF
ncbi:unnamed protein product [Allacma fusca]|uniref:Uncharacterized protein n=1 Tax=Allacma fusca TaxID=39272 RepID=A0A8J2K152_9HEXA|nr:unnamed protein product [Allacma fusca]